MRDPARDVGPGRAALVEQLLRDILETQHIAVALRHRLCRKRRRLRVAPRQLHDRLMLFAGQQPREFRRDICERLAGQFPGALPDQMLGGSVGEQDAVFGIDRDDCRRDAGQHRLDEAAARFELFVDADECPRLPLELFGHPVECARQHRDFVIARRRRHAHRQIAARRGPRRPDQSTERAHDAVGDDDRGDHREREKQQRPEIKCAVELKLQLLRSFEQIIVIRQHGSGARGLLESGHIGIARSIDIGAFGSG